MAYTTIDKPTDYFEAFAYTGDGNTKVNFASDFTPNMTWFKVLNNTYDHQIHDSVRGVSAGYLDSATTVVEQSSYPIASFDSDGVTTVSGNITGVNKTSDLMCSWNWKKSATAGFDIVAYTGTGSSNAVSHSLSATPSMIIIKNRDDADSWYVWHQGLGAVATNYINLDTNGAKSSVSDGITAISSSNFTVNTRGDVNASSEKYIAYCFSEVKGFSKFGSYTGNGNADGTFVYTGFKPAFTIIKPTSIAGDWRMHDNKRNPHNVLTQTLKPNSSGADDATASGLLDYTSNGFKWRTNSTYSNGSGVSFIYMCFASNPFTTSTGVPATAR